MITIWEFIWDDYNIDHIARHHVKQEEVEQVFDSPYYLRKLWHDRYMALGRTFAGRYLFVAFDYVEQEVYTASARSMSQKEKRLFKREMR